jgi:hypothetical protein
MAKNKKPEENVKRTIPENGDGHLEAQHFLESMPKAPLSAIFAGGPVIETIFNDPEEA